MQSTMVKWTLALALGVAVALPPRSEAASLGLGQASAVPGQVPVALPLSLALGSGEQISAFSVDVYFDTALAQWQSIALEPSVMALGKQVETNLVSPGHIRLIIYGADRQIFTSGTVAQCLLGVSPTAPSGSSLVTLGSGLGADPNGNELSLSLSDGRLWVDAPPGSATAMVLTATQTSALSAGWSTSGTERYAWDAGAWLEYQVDFGPGGAWTLGLTAMNRNSAADPGLPPGYAFNIAVAIDGVTRGNFSVPGSTTNYQTGTLALTLPAGLHTVRFTWTNDAWSAGLYDANIRVREVSFTPEGTPPPPPADTTPPQISSVAVTNVTTSGATLTWTTDEPATSQVEHGTTSGYGKSTALDATLVTDHSVSLVALNPGTLYHDRVRSKDATGNEAMSTDATFSTQALAVVETPVITPAGGTFTDSVSVSLATATAGAAIRYTVDGSAPTVASPMYNGAFSLTSSATVRAKAFKSGMTDSAEASAAFTVTPATPPAPTGLVLAATQASALSGGWSTSGTERYAWNANTWLEYRVDFGAGGSWTIGATAMNKNSSAAPGLPGGYAFNLAVSVDGVAKGNLQVPGSTTSYQTGTIGLTMLAGLHTVRFTWTNDAYSAGLYDANVRIKEVSFTPGAAAPPSPPPTESAAVQIVSPTANSTVTGMVYVNFTVTGATLRSGDAYDHVHLTLDGSQVWHVYNADPFAIPNLKNGWHTVELELVDNVTHQRVSGTGTYARVRFKKQ